MIFELFKLMMKEEVRIHTKLFPAVFFYLFPFVAFAFSFIISILFNDVAYLASLFMVVVFFAGITSGAYGIEARELYLRKFPHTNFLLYSYFAMPIRNEIILMAMFLKEVTFSFFWFLLPFLIGFFSFNPVLIANAVMLFLFANSLSFLLSNLYNKGKVFYPALLLSALLIAIFFGIISSNYLISAVLFIATFASAMKTVNLEYHSKRTFHQSMFDGLIKYLRSPLVVKDMIDLKRSYGIARIIVSAVFPIIVVYILLMVFQKIMGANLGAVINPDSFYSLMLGVASLAVYDTMVEFDKWDFYSILPMKKSDLIKSKLKSSVLITIPILLALIFVLTRFDILFNFAIGLASMLYFISIIVFIVGLDTNMLLDARRILLFSAFFAPYFMLVLFSVQTILVLITSFVLSLVLLSFGIRRFD
jgi:hypothetical protein